MTVIETAPTRIALMAMDASDEIQYTTAFFQETLDGVMRPAVIVEVGDAEYPAAAAGIEYPIENFVVSLLADKYTGATDDAHAKERRMRGIAAEIIRYFSARTQLQYSNRRGLSAAPLGALSGVMWARLSRRGVANVLQREGEGPFFGCEFTVQVMSVSSALEVVI